MHFTKMHGAGNDYLYVDCFAEPIPIDAAGLARRMSDRRFGVGGDGLILICPTDRADAEMRMFNADGSPSEMCGNGIRCVAKYVYDHGIARRNPLSIESAGRIYTLELHVKRGSVESVRVDMGEPILTPGRNSDESSLSRRAGGAGRRRADQRRRPRASRDLRLDGEPALCHFC